MKNKGKTYTSTTHKMEDGSVDFVFPHTLRHNKLSKEKINLVCKLAIKDKAPIVAYYCREGDVDVFLLTIWDRPQKSGIPYYILIDDKLNYSCECSIESWIKYSDISKVQTNNFSFLFES